MPIVFLSISIEYTYVEYVNASWMPGFHAELNVNAIDLINWIKLK